MKFMPRMAKMIQTTTITKKALRSGPSEADNEFTMIFMDLYLEMNRRGRRQRKIWVSAAYLHEEQVDRGEAHVHDRTKDDEEVEDAPVVLQVGAFVEDEAHSDDLEHRLEDEDRVGDIV
jgi:hypothetical protein